MTARSAPPVRFGFLGAGWIAHRSLAPAVHAADGAVLQAVAARDAGRAGELEPAGRAYDDYRAVLDDPDVDVVYVNLANDVHEEWTLAALAAGKHVLCEKPLGLDPGQVRRMVDAAAAADRLLVEAFWYRWHPRTRRLEQLVTTGALGPVHLVEAEFSFDGRQDPRLAGNFRLDPARGGGALYDVGCYTVSAANLALGPDLVVDDARTELGPTGVDLDTTARVRSTGGPHPGGIGVLRCGIWGRDREALSVHGEAARVDLTVGDAFSNRHVPSALTITTPDRSVRTEEFAPVDPYRLMVEAVARRVRGGSAFLVTTDHSIEVARTLHSVRRHRAGSPGAVTG